MKIAIVGAGAMGSLFGALLAESGADVSLIDVWKAHVDAVNNEGLTIEWDGDPRNVPLKALTDPQGVGHVELVIVFVKSTHTAQAIQTAASLAGESGYVLTLQNGLGNAEVISERVDRSRIIAGTTSHGATLIGPGHIRHAGKGQTLIGMWFGGYDAILGTVAQCFRQAGIDTEEVDDVRGIVWNKLLVNVGINAITALTGIKNGEILDLGATRELSRAAVEEASDIARGLGISVNEDVVDKVFGVARATAANRSSMGQDVDRKRETEIEAINGAVVREAQKLGLDAPVNRTLTALIQTLQAHY